MQGFQSGIIHWRGCPLTGYEFLNTPKAAAKATEYGRAVEEYLTHLRAAGRSTLTLETYAMSLAILGRKLGASLPLTSISTEGLEAAFVDLVMIDGAEAQKRSESTLNRFRSICKSFFRWAFETGRTPANPAARFRLARVDSPPTAAITRGETQRLLSVIRNSNDPLRLRDEALFATYALTGLRRAEALCLDAADFDVAAKTLRVKAGKGRQTRGVPVVDSLGHLLEGLLNDGQAKTVPTAGKLFPGRVKGRGLTGRQAQRRFDYWKDAANLRRELTIHSFRAGFATALHGGCGDVVLVARALGHRDLRPTLRYVDFSNGWLAQIVERTFGWVV